MTKNVTSRPPSKAQLVSAEAWLLAMGGDFAELIEFAWDHAATAPGDFAVDFYKNLFQAAPEVISLFSGDMTEQQGRLTHTLSETVALVRDPEHLLLLLKASGVRHHHYQVKQHYFDLMGHVLIETIAMRVGVAFTAEHRDAWELLFSNLSTVMREAMHRASKS